MTRAFIRVEYDTHYTGGDYSGVGDWVGVPVELVKRLGSVEAAFTEQTGLPACHIVHYCPDELAFTAGQ